jgi:hypothetical protein
MFLILFLFFSLAQAEAARRRAERNSSGDDDNEEGEEEEEDGGPAAVGAGSAMGPLPPALSELLATVGRTAESSSSAAAAAAGATATGAAADAAGPIPISSHRPFLDSDDEEDAPLFAAALAHGPPAARAAAAAGDRRAVTQLDVGWLVAYVTETRRRQRELARAQAPGGSAEWLWEAQGSADGVADAADGKASKDNNDDDDDDEEEAVGSGRCNGGSAPGPPRGSDLYAVYKDAADTVVIDIRRINWQFVSVVYLRGQKSALECCIHWTGDADVRLNKADWSADETRRLTALVAEYGGRNWVRIASELGTHRAPHACLAQWQRKCNPALVTSQVFTKAHDMRLAHLVAVHGDASWPLVSAEMNSGHLPGQLVTRWRKTLDPTLKHGRWTVEEDLRLLLAVKAYARPDPSDAQAPPLVPWNQVQLHVPGRTDLKCRERYARVLSKEVRRCVTSLFLCAAHFVWFYPHPRSLSFYSGGYVLSAARVRCRPALHAPRGRRYHRDCSRSRAGAVACRRRAAPAPRTEAPARALDGYCAQGGPFIPQSVANITAHSCQTCLAYPHATVRLYYLHLSV